MCGIVGYIGDQPAQAILLGCLGRLEYRGYDSCGIAVDDDVITVHKDALRVAELSHTLKNAPGTNGIGHTRWATHGIPSKLNAHPQSDCQGNISVVHNGIINNYVELKARLAAAGHSFKSDTDTEVIPHLIEEHFHRLGDLEQALEAALGDIDGSYALIVLGHQEERLLAVRRDSPLVIGLGDHENFIASDVPALIDHTSRVLYPEDGDICTVTRDGVAVKRDGAAVKLPEVKVPWTLADARKGGYAHYMLKEIHEQPKVIRDIVGIGMAEDDSRLDLGLAEGQELESILILACGTSHHAALVAKHFIEATVNIPVRVEMASEFDYYANAHGGSLALTITQSGETADVLRAMKKLKEVGYPVVAMTNVLGASATRIADRTVYTHAGPEISVAASKSFIAQIMVIYLMMLPYTQYDDRTRAGLRFELRQLANRVQRVLDNEPRVIEVARELARYENAFFVARGINFPVALEGALKLKEISYIHAEGYAAGELKHGPFALLGPKHPVVAVVSPDQTYRTMLTSIKEIKSRQSPIIAVTEEGDQNIDALADMVIPVPAVNSLFAPVVNTVALQLLAYHVARERGCPVDFPRNLAKSVTVE